MMPALNAPSYSSVVEETPNIERKNKNQNISSKRSSSLGATLRDLFRRGTPDPSETIPVPWKSEDVQNMIAKHTKPKLRSQSLESSTPNTPQSPVDGLGPPNVKYGARVRENSRTKLPSISRKITADSDYIFIPPNPTNTHNPKPSKHKEEGIMVETVIQGHRGGYTDVAAMASRSSHGDDPPHGWLAHLAPAKPAGTRRPEAEDVHDQTPSVGNDTPSRGNAGQNKTVIVRYSVPHGQAFLPINLDETVTMIQIGDHYGQGVFEPINTYLRSNEDGLRFYRSMNSNDPYNGPLDVSPWHVAVVGETSEDKNWLIAPVKYDPTMRPSVDFTEAIAAGAAWSPDVDATSRATSPAGGNAVTVEAKKLNLSSPAGTASPLGGHTASTPQDMDLGLLSELGQAITRGAEDLHSRWRLPPADSGNPAHIEHGAQPIPITAPTSPQTVMVPIYGGTSLPSSTPIKDHLTETSVAVVVGALGAVAGASAGEMIGGDMASQYAGPLAQPIGEFAGRNIGRAVGGILGGSAIRCSSRSKSVERKTSVVSFQVEPQPALPAPSSAPLPEDRIMKAMAQGNQDLANVMMDNMAKMFNMARSDSLQREDAVRAEITAVRSDMETRDKEAAVMARDQLAMTSQVAQLVTTVKSLRGQLDVNADFSVDALQQVRDEFSSSLNNLRKEISGAQNAGGASSSKDESQTPLVNNMGRPAVVEADDFSILCSYCDGQVPKIIAKHCGDCDCHFHPGHYQSHRDDWPCPLVDLNMCPWCAEHIGEEQNVEKCEICQYTLHKSCYDAHNPCPSGWTAKEAQQNELPKRDLLQELDATDAKFTKKDKIHVQFADTSGYESQFAAFQAKMAAEFEDFKQSNPKGATTSQTYQSDASKASGYPSSPARSNSSQVLANLGVAPKWRTHWPRGSVQQTTRS